MIRNIFGVSDASGEGGTCLIYVGLVDALSNAECLCPLRDVAACLLLSLHSSVHVGM